MARVKKGVNAHKRHKKVLKLAKGFYGQKSKVFRAANPAVMRSLRFAYIGRKLRKRDFRKSGMEINRKLLFEIAIHDAEAFTTLCDTAKKACAK